MKFVVLLTLLFSLTSYAQESQKCVDTINKGRDFLLNSIKLHDLAVETVESVKEGDDVCKALHKAQVLIIHSRMAKNDGRITTQDAILYCSTLENRKIIIQNLNAAHEMGFTISDFFQDVVDARNYYGCNEDQE